MYVDGLFLFWTSSVTDAQLRLANQSKGRTLFETGRELRGGLLIEVDEQESPPLPNTLTLPSPLSLMQDWNYARCVD